MAEKSGWYIRGIQENFDPSMVARCRIMLEKPGKYTYIIDPMVDSSPVKVEPERVYPTRRAALEFMVEKISVLLINLSAQQRLIEEMLAKEDS